MNLKYFKITDSLDAIKAQHKKYLIKYHEDRFPDAKEKAIAKRTMNEILTEYNYVTNDENRKQKPKQAHTNMDIETATQQAQNIFHALTCEKGIDYLLLYATVQSKMNIPLVAEIFFKKYKTQIIELAEQKTKDAKTPMVLRVIGLKNSDALNILKNIFK